jgi:hypothetical protein
MEFAFVQKCLNVQFLVEILLCNNFQLEMILCATCQIYSLHISFLVFQSMENPLPYSLRIETSDLQSLNVQI